MAIIHMCLLGSAAVGFRTCHAWVWLFVALTVVCAKLSPCRQYNQPDRLKTMHSSSGLGYFWSAKVLLSLLSRVWGIQKGVAKTPRQELPMGPRKQQNNSPTAYGSRFRGQGTKQYSSSLSQGRIALRRMFVVCL